VFLGVCILAFSAVFGFVNFYTLPQTSAEEFEKNFAADPVASADMSGTYNFDTNHTTIGFRAKHMGLIDIPGYFRDFTGAISYNAADVSKSSVEFTAKTTSINTGVDRRDNHLRSKDFFEVETFPEMKFKSTKIEKKGDNWMVSGDLTIKNVTKQVTFPFHIAGFVEQGPGVKIGVSSETTINRREFNINWGGNLPNGSAMVADNIAVNIQIEAAMEKKPEKAEMK
jgi:polyisoprenoid-binding protein YceI